MKTKLTDEAKAMNLLIKNLLIKNLGGLGCCPSGLDWLKKQPSAEVAWAKCQRADWMDYVIWVTGLGYGDPDYRKIAEKLYWMYDTYRLTPNERARSARLSDKIREHFTIQDIVRAAKKAAKAYWKGEVITRYDEERIP